MRQCKDLRILLEIFPYQKEKKFEKCKSLSEFDVCHDSTPLKLGNAAFQKEKGDLLRHRSCSSYLQCPKEMLRVFKNVVSVL